MDKTLSEVFDRCKSEQYAPLLHGGRVRSLAVSRDRRQMICQAGFDAPVSRADLGGLGKEIAAAYHLSRFSISPRYEMDGLSDEYITQLRADLYEEHPSAQGLLNGNRWQMRDGALEIEMSQTAADYLTVALRQLQERIAAETGLSIPVRPAVLGEQAMAEALAEQQQARAAAMQAAAAASVPPPEDRPKPKPRPAPRSSGEGVPFQRSRVEKVADDDLILGKLYAEPVSTIRDALHEFDRVTVEGTIFFVDHKEIVSKKTGKEWVKLAFDMTDNTNSIRVSKFMAKDQAGELVSALKTGLYVRVQGKISYDTYEKENMLDPAGIMKAKKPMRKDTAEHKRVELHLHSNMSAMDGVTDIKEFLNRAKAWGMPALAITDHGCAQAFPLALHVVDGKEQDYPKVLYGVEAYYVNDSEAVSVVRGEGDAPLDGAFIVFDLETTGLKPATEEITEIAAVLVEKGEVRDSFQTYVNPHKPIPPEITELTGISDETVRDAPELRDAVERFLAFAGDRPLVAHNAGFDMSFLTAACKRLEIDRAFTSIDTLEMSRILMPDLGKYKLNILAKHLQVGPFEHHRASEDAAVLGRIWIKLLEMLRDEHHAARVRDINPVLAGLRAKSGSVKNLQRCQFIILAKNQTGIKSL